MRAKPNAQPNQSLIDGIATLQALATSPEPVGSRELARRLDIDPTKINRLLKTLAYLGIARQTANRKYTAGSGMHVLAAQSLFASGLIRRALPVLEGLRRFGHTVALGVLWGDSVSYLFHAPPGIEASRGLGRIGLLPATTSGIGIVLLSELEDDEVRDVYKDREIPMFADGIEQLLAKLAEVRRLGYARVHVADERDHHVVAVSTGDPAHAGIALSGWIPETATEPLVLALREAAPEIGG
ncbi:IclR family transcriptional regulator [Sphingomonas sp. CJ20]